jgi:thiosulfate dehydrogenase
MRSRPIGALIIGVIIGLLIPAIGAYAYFRLGLAPVATAAAPMPFEKMAARMALKARIEKEAPKSSPIQADDQTLNAGAQLYVQHCAACHGQPGKKATTIAKGMFPVPPQLFQHGVTDDPVGETYWKIANGIRMTGMPAYTGSLTDTQLWQLAQMLANADKLPAAAKSTLTQPILIPSEDKDPQSGSTPPPQDNPGSIAPHKEK